MDSLSYDYITLQLASSRSKSGLIPCPKLRGRCTNTFRLLSRIVPLPKLTSYSFFSIITMVSPVLQNGVPKHLNGNFDHKYVTLNPFRCNLCSKGFMSSGNHGKHIRRIQEKARFPRTLSYKSFTLEQYLKEHIIENHSPLLMFVFSSVIPLNIKPDLFIIVVLANINLVCNSCKTLWVPSRRYLFLVKWNWGNISQNIQNTWYKPDFIFVNLKTKRFRKSF